MESRLTNSSPDLPATFNPLAGDQLENPFPVYAAARESLPVFFSPAYRMWVVTRYEDVRFVTDRPDLFSSKDSINPIVEFCPEAYGVLATGFPPTAVLVNSDPPDHERWRRAIRGSFSGPRMRRLEPEVRELASARIDRLKPAGKAEIMEDLAYPIPLQVIARLFGLGDERLDDLKRWSFSFISLISSALDCDRQVKAANDLVEFQHFMKYQMDLRRSNPGEDIISELLHAGGEQRFTDGELVYQLTGLLLAGHETTTNFIGKALFLLLSEPDRWGALVRSPSLVPQAVEEALRYDTSVPTFLRTATTDIGLAGQSIKGGDRVLVVYGSANRDSSIFEEPDTFDLHRSFDRPHMGFGHGIHYCVGAPLARMQSRVVLETLVDRLPGLRLAQGQEFHHVPTLIFRGL
ncbi:MAG TPA: cytochrome P450, partial [Actinomycetota bacterium]|nr:cytochrome P450 [Actinomycetota bacterium]